MAPAPPGVKNKTNEHERSADSNCEPMRWEVHDTCMHFSSLVLNRFPTIPSFLLNGSTLYMYNDPSKATQSCKKYKHFHFNEAQITGLV